MVIVPVIGIVAMVGGQCVYEITTTGDRDDDGSASAFGMLLVRLLDCLIALLIGWLIGE